jgi:hypothetical protein
MLVRTRYFLVGSALTVAVGLCAGLVAYYSGSLPLRASTIGPAELTYLPSSTTGVAYADVRDILDSEFHQKLSAMMPKGNGKHELLAETGIDLEEDIDSVVAGLTAAGDTREMPLVLLRGRFDRARIERVATARGASTEQHQGRTLLVFGPAGRARPGLALLEAGLVALGETDALRRAIDASLSGTSIVEQPELMKLIAQVDGAGNAWAVGRVADLAGSRALPDQVAAALPAVQWVSASFDVGQAVRGRVLAQAVDDARGEQLRTVVNGAIALGKVASAKDPRLATVLNTVQTSGTGPTVEVSFTVPPETIDLIHSPRMPSTPEAR